MIGPKKIEYNGKTNFSFATFDLLCDISYDDSESGAVSSGLNRELLASVKPNGRFKYVSGSRYNETLMPQIALHKADFTDFTIAEIRQTMSWLTSKMTPSWLDVYDDADSNAITYSLFGVPTQIETEKATTNRVIGIVFIFECTSPFAYSKLKTLRVTNNGMTNFSVRSLSDDLQEFAYPRITITNNSNNIINVSTEYAREIYEADKYLDGSVYYDGLYYYYKLNGTKMCTGTPPRSISTSSFRLRNNTTNNELYVKNIEPNEIITIDCNNRIISAQERIFADDFSWTWVGFIRGLNDISITGNCVVDISWRDPFMVGQAV